MSQHPADGCFGRRLTRVIVCLDAEAGGGGAISGGTPAEEPDHFLTCKYSQLWDSGWGERERARVGQGRATARLHEGYTAQCTRGTGFAEQAARGLRRGYVKATCRSSHVQYVTLTRSLTLHLPGGFVSRALRKSMSWCAAWGTHGGQARHSVCSFYRGSRSAMRA